MREINKLSCYKGTLALLLVFSFLPLHASMAATKKNDKPGELIFVSEIKQYWYKPVNKDAAIYIGQDKKAELNRNIKDLKINLKKVKRQIIRLTKPIGRDTDSDGLPDTWELLFGTNPRSKDTDGDRSSDKLEVIRGMNPNGVGKLIVYAEKKPVVKAPSLLATFKAEQGTDKLKRFASLAEYKKFLTDNQNNQAYYNNYYDMISPRIVTGVDANLFGGAEIATAKSAVSDSQSLDTSLDYSATNVQVGGVDEADTAKTDGKYIYSIKGNKVLVVEAVPANNASVISEIELKEGAVSSLYLSDGILTVIGSEYLPTIFLKNLSIRYGEYYQDKSVTYVKVFDVHAPAVPKLIKDFKFDGRYTDSRRVNNNLYLVLTDYARSVETPLPSYFVNDKLVSDEKLPYYFDTNYNELNMVSLVSVSLAMNNDTIKSEHFFIPQTGSIFASADNFYLTYGKMVSEDDLLYEIARAVVFEKLSNAAQAKILAIEKADKLVLSESEKRYKITEIARRETANWKEADLKSIGLSIKNKANEVYGNIAKELDKTIIHKISLKDGDLNYLAEGSVSGQVLNQFAMNEQGDNFFIATTKYRTYSVLATEAQNDSYSNVYALDADLKQIGSLESLAPGERMYAARFIGSRLYMVTFKQVDPLFVIDLSVPSAPKVLGELKLPGFSTYIHPYDETTLIGIGRDATTEGGVGGLKLALFDVSNVESPKVLSSLNLGLAGSYSTAINDHKQFVFSSSQRLLFLPVNLSEKVSYSNDFLGVSVIDMSNKEIKERGRVAVEAPSYYGSDIKTLYIDSNLYTITSDGMKINDTTNLTQLKNIVFPDVVAGLVK